MVSTVMVEKATLSSQMALQFIAFHAIPLRSLLCVCELFRQFLSRIIERIGRVPCVLKRFVQRLGLGNQFRVKWGRDDVTAFLGRLEGQNEFTVTDCVRFVCNHSW